MESCKHDICGRNGCMGRSHPTAVPVPMQKFQHTGKLGKELGASVPVSRALLDAQMHNTQKEAYTLNGQRCDAPRSSDAQFKPGLGV